VIQVDLRELSKDLAKTELVYRRDSYLKILDTELLRVEPDGSKKAYLIPRSTIFNPERASQGSRFLIWAVSLLGLLFLHFAGFILA
jgi:hypothetical protein